MTGEIILPPQDGDAIEIGDLYRKGKMVDSVRYLIEGANADDLDVPNCLRRAPKDFAA